MIESLGAIRRFLHLVKVAVVAALILALAALAWDAHAQTPCPTGAVANDAARVCWRNAGTIETHTEIARGRCAATGAPATVDQVFRVTADVGHLLFEGLPAGWWCFRGRHVVVRAEGEDTSTWTAWVRKELTAPRPSRPQTITVE